MSYTGGVTGEGDSAWAGRGSRRQKFAGYLRAANELRQSYQASYSQARTYEDEFNADGLGIPGAFPDLKVARSGHDEMVLFPSYARHHTKTEKRPAQNTVAGDDLRSGNNDADYWKNQWEIYEDANAIVDVDIRGWIYSPHRGPLNRKSRLMVGIARKLSGIPAPGGSEPSSRASSRHRERHEEEMVEREAQNLAQKGEHEADVAGRGGYSEGPGRAGSAPTSRNPSPKPGDLHHQVTGGSLEETSTALTSRASWNQPSDMTPEELKMANTAMMARIRPFLTNPSVDMPLTVFFYNDETSQSRTTSTNESGHFNLRAALSFVPTHVRVLASENLSATEEVLITEPQGVSLISDIDDTIKHSAIGAGAREIFRNAFIRELGDLTIAGVKEWYYKMADMGVKLHYVSNSPWQMYPLLVSYFAKAGLPPGSFHLKQYSGMLQGIFEPVAERKRGTLDRILGDFPDRRFILVGDSGEADLEVYTETAIMNPGRILGIFIRDVTTAPKKGFFDPSNGSQGSKPPFPQRPNVSNGMHSQAAGSRPVLPTRSMTTAAPPQSNDSGASDLGDLIDLSEDFEAVLPPRSNTGSGSPLAPVKSNASSVSTRSGPPVAPRKPPALRSRSNEFATQAPTDLLSAPNKRTAPPRPPKPRQLSNSGQTSANSSTGNSNTSTSKQNPPPLPPDRAGYRASAMNRLTSAYNHIPSASAYWNGTSQVQAKPSTPSSRAMFTSPNAPPIPAGTKSTRTSTSTSTTSSSSSSTQDTQSGQAPALPPRRGISSYPAAAAAYASNKWYGTEGAGGDDGNGPVLSKREELWNRRWARAKEVLSKKGVVLKTWRSGEDVAMEAIELVKKAERDAKESQEGKRQR